MRRPTTPSSQGNSRRVSPVVSARGNARPKSPVIGTHNNNQQPQTDYQKLAAQLNIRGFSQVSNKRTSSSSHNNNFSTPQHNTGGNNNNNSSSINHPSYPPPMMMHQRSPRVAPGSTPNSARSASCINDLEGAIHEVMKERMNSLTESRKRVEELAELQRRETEMFLSSMEHILASSNVASTAQTDMMEDYEDRLTKEKSEKGRMLDILQRFKAEGDRVTSDLKRALFDEREKHKEASWRNEQLNGKIRELQSILTKYQQQIKELQNWKQQHQNSIMNNNNTNAMRQQQQQQPPSTNQGMSNDQISQLVELLKEHERVIDELERRNRNLEHDLRYQQNSRFRQQTFRDGSAESLESIHIPENIPEDGDSPGRNENNEFGPSSNNNRPPLNTLVQQFSRDLGISMTHDSLSLLVKGLLNQVRNENRSRLRVEEQYTKLVTDQDNQIRKLEGKLRDYEAIMANNGVNPTSNSKTFLGSPSPARVAATAGGRQQQQVVNSPATGANNINNNTKSRQQPGGVVQTASGPSSTSGPRLPTLTGTNSNTTSNQNSGTNTPRTGSIIAAAATTGQQQGTTSTKLDKPKPQATIGLEQQQQQILEDEDIPPASNPPPAVPSSSSQQHRAYQATSQNEDDDVEFAPVTTSNRNTANNNHSAQQQHQQQAKEGSVDGKSDLPSLEDQLNAVTNDFNQSLEMWNKAAATPKAQQNEDEFQPE